MKEKENPNIIFGKKINYIYFKNSIYEIRPEKKSSGLSTDRTQARLSRAWIFT